MDLRRLGHFLAVVDHGGFTAASKAVLISQPALSLAVKELEAELGTELFARIGRRALLTPAGEALVGPARQVLRDIETGRAAVLAVAGLETGRLSLASLPTLAADPLADLVGRFRRCYSGVQIDLAAPEGTTEIMDLIANGACEIGVIEAHEVPTNLVIHALGTQDLVLIFPPGDASRSSSVALVDLEEIAFVAAPPGTSTRRLLDEGFAAVGRLPRIAVIAAQRDAILPLVLSGAAAALVPQSIGNVARQLGATLVRPVPSIQRQVALAHRAGSLAPAAARFVELALESRA